MFRDINSKWVLLGKLNRKSFCLRFPRQTCSPRSAQLRSIPAVQHLPLEAEERLHEGAGQPEPMSLEKLSPPTAQAWEGDGSR